MAKNIVTYDDVNKKYEPSELDITSIGSNDSKFVQINNLQVEPVGTGFIPFWGLVEQSSNKNVLGLPKDANSSVNISDPNLDNSKWLSTRYVFNGYQIDSGNNVVTQVVQWGNTQWYRRGTGKQPNVTWGKWQLHGYNQEFNPAVDKYDIREGLEYTSINTVVLKRMSNEIKEEQEYYKDYFSSYDNLIHRDITGTYAGHQIMGDNAVIYVDSVNGSDSNKGTKEAPKKTLEFLSEIPARKSCIIFLKCGGVYNTNAGIGRNTAHGGVRIFSAYGDEKMQAFKEKYKDSVTVKWWGCYGLMEKPKPILRMLLSRKDATSLSAPFVSHKGGTHIFEGIKFEMKAADGSDATTVAETKNYMSFFRVGGGEIEFRFCDIEYGKITGQGKQITFIGQSTFNPSTLRFYNCKLVNSNGGEYNPNIPYLLPTYFTSLHIVDNYDFGSVDSSETIATGDFKLRLQSEFIASNMNKLVGNNSTISISAQDGNNSNNGVYLVV